MNKSLKWKLNVLMTVYCRPACVCVCVCLLSTSINSIISSRFQSHEVMRSCVWKCVRASQHNATDTFRQIRSNERWGEKNKKKKQKQPRPPGWFGIRSFRRHSWQNQKQEGVRSKVGLAIARSLFSVVLLCQQKKRLASFEIYWKCIENIYMERERKRR